MANFVNLHGQINQPIAKSPLLMACYMNHMTQLHCSDWSTVVPHSCISQGNSQGKDLSGAGAGTSGEARVVAGEGVTYIDRTQPSTWIPRFAYINEGFMPGLMVTRNQPPSPPTLSNPPCTGVGPGGSADKQKKQFLFDALEPSSTPVLGKLSFI